jgi:hypothetical protein
MERTAPHDNTSIKVTNSFNGNIVIVGGIYIGGISSIFLILFLATHWQQAIVLSGVLIYGLLSVFALMVAPLVAWVWIKLVIQPFWHERNKIKHTQENAIVIINALGNVEVVPLVEGLRPTIVEADPTSELAIVDMYNHNVTQKTIAEGLGISQSTVSRVVAKHKKETGG